jgi:hypothetical protein
MWVVLVAAGWVNAVLAHGISLPPCTAPTSSADLSFARLRLARFLADREVPLGGEGGELPSLVALQAPRGMAAACESILESLASPETPVSFSPALTLAEIFRSNLSGKTSNLSTSPKKEGSLFGLCRLFWKFLSCTHTSYLYITLMIRLDSGGMKLFILNE